MLLPHEFLASPVSGSRVQTVTFGIGVRSTSWKFSLKVLQNVMHINMDNKWGSKSWLFVKSKDGYVYGEKISRSPRVPLDISPVEDDWLVIGVDGHA